MRLGMHQTPFFCPHNPPPISAHAHVSKRSAPGTQERMCMARSPPQTPQPRLSLHEILTFPLARTLRSGKEFSPFTIGPSIEAPAAFDLATCFARLNDPAALGVDDNDDVTPLDGLHEGYTSVPASDSKRVRSPSPIPLWRQDPGPAPSETVGVSDTQGQPRNYTAAQMGSKRRKQAKCLRQQGDSQVKAVGKKRAAAATQRRIDTEYDLADDSSPTKPAWIGLRDAPFARAISDLHDAELDVLKEELTYVNWDGRCVS